MRHVVLASIVLAGGTAQAQSLTPLATDTHASTTSMVVKNCDDCPPLLDRSDRKGAYRVPELAAGVQSVSIMEIDGEKKIVRTESWMGGSPVVYISKVPDWMTAEHLQTAIRSGNAASIESQVEDALEASDTIDFSARTGAVSDDDKARSFDDLPLRLK